MRRKVKFKKVMFPEMPSDFVYFKQYNITAKQVNALHTVEPSNQKVITVDNIYIASESTGSK